MSVEIKSPLFYWNRFTPGIKPSGARRIHLNPTFDKDGCPVSIQASGFDSSGQTYNFVGNNPVAQMFSYYQANVDSSVVYLPESDINNTHFIAYKSRLQIAGSEYERMIQELAEAVIFKGNPKPHAFVAIPTRKESSTSNSIDVIRKSFAQSGMIPYFLVLHNDKTTPLDETMADLDKVRNENDVFVIDLNFTDESNIGDARAIPADVIMEINSISGLNTPMITADADITVVRSGTYKKMIEAIERGCTAATAFSEFDPATITENKTFYVLQKAKGLYYRVADLAGKFDAGLLGVGFGMNMKILPVLGGMPRANQLEDGFLEHTIKQNRFGTISHLPIKSGLTLSNGSRHANAMIGNNPQARYADFDGFSNELRTVALLHSLDLELVISTVNYYIQEGSKLGTQSKALLCKLFNGLCSEFGLPVGSGDGEVKLHLLNS